MTYPKPVKIDSSDAKRLREIRVKAQAIQSFIDMITTNGQQRISKLQMEAEEAWGEVAKKYGLDLKTVTYDLDPNENVLMPTQMRFIDTTSDPNKGKV